MYVFLFLLSNTISSKQARKKERKWIEPSNINQRNPNQASTQQTKPTKANQTTIKTQPTNQPSNQPAGQPASQPTNQPNPAKQTKPFKPNQSNINKPKHSKYYTQQKTKTRTTLAPAGALGPPDRIEDLRRQHVDVRARHSGHKGVQHLRTCELPCGPRLSGVESAFIFGFCFLGFKGFLEFFLFCLVLKGFWRVWAFWKIVLKVSIF